MLEKLYIESYKVRRKMDEVDVLKRQLIEHYNKLQQKIIQSEKEQADELRNQENSASDDNKAQPGS